MTPQPRRSPAVTRLAVALALCALGALAGGCATVAPAGTEPVAANPIDPWENFNRKVYAFNEGLDEALLRPLAEAYRDVVPELVRTGVDNFFGNVYDAWSAVNQLLQGKLEDSLVMGTRVATNTLFGPSTIRDATGLWVDRQVSPAQLSDSETKRWVIGGMEVVNVRTKLLQTLRLLDDVALDKYAFVRDAYLARRRDAVFDGAPPFEDLGDDWEDEPPAAAPAPPAAASAPQTPR